MKILALCLTMAFILVNGLQDNQLHTKLASSERCFIQTPGAKLGATLDLPAGDGLFPGVLLISGSGSQDRSGSPTHLPAYKPFDWLSEALTSQGVAVLRYDDRGSGESVGDLTLSTTEDYADDAEAAFSYLLAHPRIDDTRVGVLGHSEGAIMAAMIASSNRSTVAFVISLGGPALPGAESLKLQTRRVLMVTGATEDEIDVAVSDQSRSFELALARNQDAIREHLTSMYLTRLQALQEAARASIGDLEAAAQQRASVSAANLMSPYFLFFLEHDPGENWRHLTVPTLAIYGELDVQADHAAHSARLREIEQMSEHMNLSVEVIEGANHLFQDAETGAIGEYTTLPMRFVEGLEQSICDWLLEVLDNERS